ncbi:hypothetical protein BV898_09212 [Hypsibius exemplaris]|uniref:Receptor ligand binding region domain-containing protein n=1 Tax=Hypsibius exemplaris TaxID=2072580 RepID=A0A1W0WNB1_HYPEX|nr:hypothetical protein BV898_09212 [Hypsibius exemplaris]
MLDVEVVSLGYFPPIGQLHLAFNAPAYDVAMDNIREKYNATINFTGMIYLADAEIAGNCFALDDNADYLFTRWYFTKRRRSALTALIMPGCNGGGGTINRITAHLNILTIYTGDPPPTIIDRAQSPTSISTAYVSLPTFVQAYDNFLLVNNWTSLFLLYNEANAAPLCRGMFMMVSDMISLVPERRQTRRMMTNATDQDVLLQFHDVSRVLLFFGHAANLRKLLITASSMNMTDGQYVYVAFEAFPMPAAYGNLNWQYGDKDDEAARLAFRSLIVIQPSSSSHPPSREARELGVQFQKRSASQYNYSYPLSRQPLSSMLAFYLSVIIFAQILNDSLSDGLDVHNGRMLANQFLDRHFDGDLDPDVYIGAAGNRIPEIVLSQFTGIPTCLTPFRKQFANNTNRLARMSDPDWPFSTPWPPPDEPHCGYRNEKVICKRQQDKDIALNYVIPIACVVLLIVVSLVYGHIIRSRKRLSYSWWFIEPSALVEMTRRLASQAYRHSNLHMESGPDVKRDALSR